MSAGRHCYSPDAPQTERLAAYLEEKEARVERREAFARRHAGDTLVKNFIEECVKRDSTTWWEGEAQKRIELVEIDTNHLNNGNSHQVGF